MDRQTDIQREKEGKKERKNHTSVINRFVGVICRLGSSVGIVTDYRLDGPGSNPGGRDFLPVQTGPRAHPASCKWVPGLSRG